MTDPTPHAPARRSRWRGRTVGCGLIAYGTVVLWTACVDPLVDLLSPGARMGTTADALTVAGGLLGALMFFTVGAGLIERRLPDAIVRAAMAAVSGVLLLLWAAGSQIALPALLSCVIAWSVVGLLRFRAAERLARRTALLPRDRATCAPFVGKAVR